MKEPCTRSSIQLDTISDGYDDGGFAQAYLSRLHDVGPKHLSDLIKRHQTSSSPLHAVIYEPFLARALEVAKDCGLFAAAFFTHACAVDYIFYNVYHEVLRLQVSSTPVLIEGLPLLLELQDLPSFVAEPDSYPANAKMTMSQFANLDKADRVLINTFYKLENEVVDTMSKACPLLTIGPTIPSIYLDERIEDEDDYGISLCEIDASLCINWLSTKPTGSVVYVSFGSCAAVSNEQMEEIAWGLKRSNFHFLWVVGDSDKGKIPEGFVEEAENKGLLVNWSPQVKAPNDLNQTSWNDHASLKDLYPQSKGYGVRVKTNEKGIVTKEEVERCTREVLESERSNVIRGNSGKWRKLAKIAVDEGGSSDNNIEEFVTEVVCKSKRIIE
ncbi:hypothetical protein OIU84_029592 [Salix udensis]|uniref:Uncharacterized protein n=1 Tax=Salix udensis TaxID=889485 RepID=A0AAD6K9N5_9ROSI|nr:hypothetical protein OIU84_029592 [Salix udensis]